MSDDSMRAPLEFFAQSGAMTDLAEYAAELAEMPSDFPALCRVVQGLLLHPIEAHRYGVAVADARWAELEAREVRRMLAGIGGLDPAPLTIPRPPERRWLGNCRDYAVLLCALLRARGMPARVRYGFATYFEPDFYTDHVICEVWDTNADRWRRVDPMIDDVLRTAYGIAIDTGDLPGDAFVPAGQAWRWCRVGQARPGQFGIGQRAPRGAAFVRSGVPRDVAGLNKVEPLCQEEWDPGVGSKAWAMLDRLAVLTLAPDEHLDQLRMAYDGTVRGLVAAAGPRG